MQTHALEGVCGDFWRRKAGDRSKLEGRLALDGKEGKAEMCIRDSCSSVF